MIGPGVPEPITRSSIRTTGLSSRVVLVMNASSARLEVGRVERLLTHLDAGLAREVEQEAPGDPLQQSRLGRRRQQHAVRAP